MRRILLKVLLLFSIAAVALVASGCAIKSALDQPDKKDTSVFERGTPRFEVIAEIGEPVDSKRLENGKLIDTYAFIQGYSKVTKAGRALA